MAAESVACPYLGLDGDPRTRFLFATPAHRCHVRRRPAAIDIDHQGRFCLTPDFRACPRYEAPASSNASAGGRRPASPNGAGASSDGQLLSVLETVRPATPPTAAPLTTTPPPDTPPAVPDVLMPAAADPPTATPPTPDRAGTETETETRGLVRRSLVLLLALIALAALVLAVVTGAFGPLPDLDPRAAGAHIAATRFPVLTVAFATSVVYPDGGRV
jgi:hypothetical protein